MGYFHDLPGLGKPKKKASKRKASKTAKKATKKKVAKKRVTKTAQKSAKKKLAKKKSSKEKATKKRPVTAASKKKATKAAKTAKKATGIKEVARSDDGRLRAVKSAKGGFDVFKGADLDSMKKVGGMSRGWLYGSWWIEHPIKGYAYLVRGKDDPARVSRKERQKRMGREAAARQWRSIKSLNKAEVKKGILKAAGKKGKTFNAIVLELSGGDMTADTVHQDLPAQALWELVEEGKLEHSNRIPILFRRRGK